MPMLKDYIQDASFGSFNYWFVRKDINSFYVGKRISPFKFTTVAHLTDHDLDLLLLDEDVRMDVEELVSEFKRYKQFRPEYLVGDSTKYEESPKDYYKKIFIGSVLCKAYREACKIVDKGVDVDSSKYVKNAESAIDWLETTDFFTCPGSTRYHDNFATGLVSHSLEVARLVAEIHEISKFEEVRIEDAVFIALVHDWCKIGLYESYWRNVKDSDGKWIQKQEYKYRDTSLTSFGHGVSSMFLAQKFFHLSLDELLAIRWHMGFCRVADSDMNELQQSNENHPLVHLIQFADQLSIVNY